MTQKKKAELQRKLSMSAVPRPPDDLARRIKAQIPDPLNMKADRERLSSSIAFSMRVAASIVLLVTSVVLSFHLVSRGEGPMSSASLEKKGETTRAASAPAAESAPASIAPQLADTAEITVTLAPEGDAAASSAKSKLSANVASVKDAPARRRDADASHEFAAESALAQKAVADSALVGSVASYERPAEAGPTSARPTSVSAPSVTTPSADAAAEEPKLMARLEKGEREQQAPPPAAPIAAGAPPPPPPVVVAAVPPAPEKNQVEQSVVRDKITVTAQAPAVTRATAMAESRGLVTTARADEIRYDRPKTIFGLSVDPNEFSRIKSTIESGRKPAPDHVNVEALVNHFAGNAAARSAVRLEVEGSRLPLTNEQGLTVLRFTVDTSAAPRGASAGPVATDASIEVVLNRNAILRHRVIGDTDQLEASEGTLLKGSSVTGLVELRVKPNLRKDTEIATVRLTYRSVENGRPQKPIEKRITAASLEKSWTSSSRRHRLATLGAVWGESLRAEGAAEDVAKAAEELAEEEPDDDRARDLATAATASSRLQSSAPTGSAR